MNSRKWHSPHREFLFEQFFFKDEWAKRNNGSQVGQRQFIFRPIVFIGNISRVNAKTKKESSMQHAHVVHWHRIFANVLDWHCDEHQQKKRNPFDEGEYFKSFFHGMGLSLFGSFANAEVYDGFGWIGALISAFF
jgi:hypothetical protein